MGKKAMRLIDANALKTSFEEDGHLSSYIEEFIDNAPTIDAEPVRHGQWETREYTTEDDWDDWGVINHREEVCSECGKWQSERSKFCSHCGAKMDGKAE